MSVIVKTGLMKHKDKAGNIYILYPIANMDNVNGIGEALADKANSTHTHTNEYSRD